LIASHCRVSDDVGAADAMLLFKVRPIVGGIDQAELKEIRLSATEEPNLSFMCLEDVSAAFHRAARFRTPLPKRTR